jgi:hypothetical protein
MRRSSFVVTQYARGRGIKLAVPDIVIRRKGGTAAIAQLAPTTN